jgi:hypothetical protein
MGHSMGGLSAREYLQNPNIWQPDGKHHVAKLVTSGTPHGGSNSTLFGIGLKNINEKLDATRDLRRDYAISGNAGVYLFGGFESDMVINNNLLFKYYNVDVNCNGIYGEYVTGLNQKKLPSDLDYSSLVGLCTDCLIEPNTSDGVVWNISANLKNYYTLPLLNLFYYFGSATFEIHTDLPKQIYENMQLLDEPNYLPFAYKIGLDTAYTGFTTIQSVGGVTNDYDDYKFKLTSNSKINILVNDISILSDLMVDIYDSLYNIVGTTVHSNGKTSINFSIDLKAGTYYLEIYGIPNIYSFLYPYSFSLNSKFTGISDLVNDRNIQVYPNPTSDLINIKGNNYSIIGEPYIINNQLGMQVLTGKLVNEVSTVDLSTLEAGFYLLQIGQEKKQTFKVIKK